MAEGFVSRVSESASVPGVGGAATTGAASGSVSRVARTGASYQKTASDWSAFRCAPSRNHGQVLSRRWVVERTFA